MQNRAHEKWMSLALQEARLAGAKGEVPVGAVIVRNDELVAKNHNRRETNRSAIAHAEILVIEEANKELGAWRLGECHLYVTLEPCLMCAGGIISSRIPKVIYGAKDPKAGAVESLFEVLKDERLNHRSEIISGVMAAESSELLSKFFKELRVGRHKFLKNYMLQSQN